MVIAMDVGIMDTDTRMAANSAAMAAVTASAIYIEIGGLQNDYR